MGALHQGHLDLVEAAGRFGDQVIVTIFVNPLQFGPNEDLARYPRCLDADLAALADSGADLVYAPSVGDMYPDGAGSVGAGAVQVASGRLGQVFEGAVRPGHFDGVLTVVLKLAHRTQAQVAVFGQKDAQQLALVRQMNDDLDLALQIVAVPTRREPDGLALSSRNRYLTTAQRRLALALPNALEAGAAAAANGSSAAAVRAVARESLAAVSSMTGTDYLELVDPKTFEPLAGDGVGSGLLIAAFKVGSTRLIDNREVVIDPPQRAADRCAQNQAV
jgi:pantoate--beta-alanine ligase